MARDTYAASTRHTGLSPDGMGRLGRGPQKRVCQGTDIANGSKMNYKRLKVKPLFTGVHLNEKMGNHSLIKGGYGMSEDLIVRIEQEAMRYIDEKRKEAKPPMSVEALANEVFPGVSNARMIIQRMRKPQANGKTRAVSFGEFIKMAKALKISPLEAVSAVLNRVDETKF